MATPGRIDYESGGEQSALLNSLFTNPITVRAFDAGGAPMPAGEPLVFGLAVSGASGTFHPSGLRTDNQVTDASGRCTCNLIRANSTLGTWTGAVQFVNNLGISGGYFNLKNVDVLPNPTSVQILSGDNQAKVQSSSFNSISAKARDQFNNGLPNCQLLFSAPAGRGNFVGGGSTWTASVDANGVASSPQFNCNTVLGALSITVSIVGTGISTTVNWAVVSATTPTAIVVYSGSGQSAEVAATFGAVLTARVTNALGDPLTGVSVTFTAPPTGASCSFTGAQTQVVNTVANGLATTVKPVANSNLGSYQVNATVAGVAAPATFNLTNGVAYQTEACLVLVAPLNAAIIAGSGTDWTNPNRAINGNTIGAQLNPVANTANDVLLCNGFAAGAFDGIDDNAKITRFACFFDYKYTGATGAGFTTRLYDGTATRSTNQTGLINLANGAYQNQSFNYTPNPAMNGADLKAGNFGIGWNVGSNSSVNQVINVRNVTFTVCYQNPVIVPPQLIPPLLMCEA